MKTNKRKVRKCLKFDNITLQNVYIWLVNFRYNCTRGQLNNEGEGELQELTQSQDKTEIGKEIIYKE